MKQASQRYGWAAPNNLIWVPDDTNIPGNSNANELVTLGITVQIPGYFSSDGMTLPPFQLILWQM